MGRSHEEIARRSSGSVWSSERDFTEKGDTREDLLDDTPALDTTKSLVALSFNEVLKVMAKCVKKAHSSGVMTLGAGNRYVQA